MAIEPGFNWICEKCGHKWMAQNPEKPPRQCAKCRRYDWNRESQPDWRRRKVGIKASQRKRVKIKPIFNESLEGLVKRVAKKRERLEKSKIRTKTDAGK